MQIKIEISICTTIESLFLLKKTDNIFLSENLELLRNYVIINCQEKKL